jgi:acyl-coenzyme A thioesterase PaaI-like protein
MLRDIRELADDPDAYAAELRQRWGGLLSYRYIGRTYASMDLGPVDDTVTLRHDMRNTTGGILLAVFGIASPEGGSMSDLEAVPNPVIHSCQVLDSGRDVRRIEVKTELVRRGRQMGFSRSRIVDADQPTRVLALTEGEGISIGTPPEGLGRMAVEPIQVIDSPDLPPLWQVFGGHRRSDGHWALPELVTETASPDAALHIGPQFVVLETAALEQAADVAGTDQLQGVASHVMFVARGKAGPFRVEAEPIAGAGGIVGARTVVRDEGVDDRVITVGSYLFRQVGRRGVQNDRVEQQ